MKLKIPLQSNVFSTYVEVILRSGTQRAALLGILHVCGGDPGRGGHILYV